MSLEIVKRLSTKEITDITNWLEGRIKPHLTPDVSNYAKDRLRCWLRYEPNFFTGEIEDVYQVSDYIWNRLSEIIEWHFDFCLITFSGSEAIGIEPHRDASYADYEARSLNVNKQCQFNYWEGRRSFGPSKNVKEYNPKIDAPTKSMLLEPGDLIKFNCKNLHEAIPKTDRWNINFWQHKLERRTYYGI